ncbi:MAG: Polyketide cyclase / dehydrase and lipid transport [Acidimicrobiales bacterium]|nr:Polyketide cyclase / dehydrase and lipid transport [Acidimicrobiales bacterium]
MTSIHASEAVELGTSPREALELVLDLHAYRQLDPKIKKVRAVPVLDDEGHGTAKVTGGLWYFPPAPDTHLVRLQPWHTLTFEGAPRVFARAIFSFTGRFEAAEVDGGTRLGHSYDITFRQPLAALFGSAVQDWLERDLRDEMARIRAHLGPIAAA